ncbi:MAG TPA: BON domain-containing protein [Candidatus Acidoferrales bacterium]
MRVARIIVVLVLIFCTAGIASAQQQNQKQPPPRGSQNYQAWLTKEVHHELALVPWYTVFDNLEYRVEGNNVTLLGQVVRPSVKSDAEAAVKSIEGIGTVDDQIEVLPVSPMDDQTRLAEYHAIYSEPSLQRYGLGSMQSIHIIVKNGHVTLVGMVANAADKNVAGIRANSVPNVFSVQNDLQVQPGS